ncbi:MAG: bifunctional proline dehydrogenase/L-glutamate gamma-semialdehyde dehydrogenase PutA [Gammaproteobacteria bacterium]|nr:bifunctional proline dehydrogenase/L-glutamate gamma-semialdehyde dehydrogenase PutA [Gammaproteobacteria bacterium]
MSSALNRIDKHKFAPEIPLVRRLAEDFTLDEATRRSIVEKAAELVRRVRTSPKGPTMLDAFLNEFGLHNDEGVALMCLAESLLRVPDPQTADELIADKLGPAHWDEHLGHSSSLLVNASTWALMLTGRAVSMRRFENQSGGAVLQSLAGRLGEPVIRGAVRQAMSILGQEFVMGETMEEAIKRAYRLDDSVEYSFDILGEGARTAEVADEYFQAYCKAIPMVGERQPDKAGRRCGMSIKLTALHPRYEARQSARVHEEMYPRLLKLCELAHEHDIPLCLDAEEADRLILSLELTERLCAEPSLRGWDGLGLAVQGYGKRARRVIRWLSELAQGTRRQISVRLVKGAYWDAEIKHAQIAGMPDYPVFTAKDNTDTSYLSCAQAMLAERPHLFCAFATHNAHTLTTVLTLAEDRSNMELQRIHGMGERLHETARAMFDDFPPVRVYAPAGLYEDLLAYLVRRLLENGANSSFVNRLYDEELAPEAIVSDPIEISLARNSSTLPTPELLYGEDRPNSAGCDLASQTALGRFSALLSERSDTPEPQAVDPASGEIDTWVRTAAEAQPAWDALGGRRRANILRTAADALEEGRDEFFRVLASEAGKTVDDAVAEVREAVDFMRYYARQAERDFESPMPQDGPTGESNDLSLHGRGVFVCISPWNFPLAIFLGQVSAALLAGNAVLAKPAEQTPRIAKMAVDLLHAAGVPADVLRLVAGAGDVGAALVNHRGIAGVAFTGGTDTAARIQSALAGKSNRPIVPFIAETGGQNVMIADSSALIEQTTDDAIRSAFLSAGQRCSALRVLCVQDEVADTLLDSIRGAAAELAIGDPHDPSTDIGPIIDQPSLDRIQAHIERMRSLDCEVWTGGRLDESLKGPYIRPHTIELESLGQLEGECFGPVMHVLRFDAANLAGLVDSINRLEFGLTLGIQSRIDARVDEVIARARMGNIYVNRDMVGAVVGVQPFGGMGLSGTGPKAGGPHYLHRYAVEKTITINTTAKGGNVELLRSVSTEC